MSMSLRVSNLRLPVDAPESTLRERLARAVGVPAADLRAWRILRKSLDVRDKRDLQFVYNAAVLVPDADEAKILGRATHSGPQVEAFDEPPFDMPDHGREPLPHRPVVIGSGPGGLVAAYFLAERGYRPLLLERGTPVNDRIRDVKAFDAGGPFEPESNYLFGEGGAGTFSRRQAHLSRDRAGCAPRPGAVRRVQGTATRQAVDSLLSPAAPGQQPAAGRGQGDSARASRVWAGKCGFARASRTSFSAMAASRRWPRRREKCPPRSRSWRRATAPATCTRCCFRRGVPIVPKPFQIGVRIEHPQELVNRVQYGSRQYEEQLGNADYALIGRGTADVFTFCMCAGGYIIPSVSERGFFCTNGMSLSKRDSPYANSGLVVTLPISEFGGDDPLAGVRIQERYERFAFELGGSDYLCPVQGAADFMAKRLTPNPPPFSYPRGGVAVNLESVLPPYVVVALRSGLPGMDRAWRGRFLKSGVLVGPESRGSSPVRIPRDEQSRESPLAGLYPVGEGAGYAGGIVSAAVDGLRTAKAIIARYAPTGR